MPGYSFKRCERERLGVGPEVTGDSISGAHRKIPGRQAGRQQAVRRFTRVVSASGGSASAPRDASALACRTLAKL